MSLLFVGIDEGDEHLEFVGLGRAGGRPPDSLHAVTEAMENFPSLWPRRRGPGRGGRGTGGAVCAAPIKLIVVPAGFPPGPAGVSPRGGDGARYSTGARVQKAGFENL